MKRPAPAAPTVAVRLQPAAEAVVLSGVGALDRIAVTDVFLHEGELLVKVELATVCGSDLHTVRGDRPSPGAHVLGHEQVGRIAALGPGDPPNDVDGHPLAIGDRVVWSVTISCGSCSMCGRGIPNKCLHVRKYGHEPLRRGWELSGGIATHVHVLAGTAIVRVRDDIPSQLLAPASCATATVAAVLEAAETVRPLDGEWVLVSGCGMLGLTAVAMARARGADVVAVDSDPSRRELARVFGAQAVHAPGGAPRGFDVGLELSGSPAAVESVIEGAATGGTIVLAGSVFPAPRVPLDAESVVRRVLTLRGVHNYAPRHLAEAVRFLETASRRAFSRLVGQIVPFDSAEEALSSPPASGARTGVRP